MKRALPLNARDRPKKPRVWDWVEPTPTPVCAKTKTITPTPPKTTTPPTPPYTPAASTTALRPGVPGTIDHRAYPHLFEAVLCAVIERRDASTLRAMRGTSRAVAARIDSAFLSDITYALETAEVTAPLKMARHRPIPPKSRLLGLPWYGQSVSTATIEVGPCECHAKFTPDTADAEVEAEAEAGAEVDLNEMAIDMVDAVDTADAVEAEEESAAKCPAHAHEERIRTDDLGRLEYVRFVGDPHAHAANWALQADTEVHVLDMFPRKGNGWTRMNRATLDSRRIALQSAGEPPNPASCEDADDEDEDADDTEDVNDADSDVPDLELGAAVASPAALDVGGKLPRQPHDDRADRPRRRVLHFRLHSEYEWLFDYCMLPPSDITHTTVLVSKYTGPVQLEAPEDFCSMCSEASGCRTNPGMLVHVKPDPTRHLSPAEGPLFGLITSLADDWTQRLRHLLKTPYPPPMNPHTAGTITFVGTERWENRWIQSRPNDVLLPSGYAREKIRQCFYWRCLSNVQDAILERFTDEIDYTTRNPRIKRWWEFVYLFINEESCFRFLSMDEYAAEVGERELELVLAEDI